MAKKMKFQLKLLIVLIVALVNVAFARGAGDDKSVLLIASYGASERRVASTVNEFRNRCAEHGVTANIHVESIDCQSFLEIREWKGRMEKIFERYSGDSIPDVIVIWGQEAAAAYRSVDADKRPNVPVVSANMSRTMIDFPSDTIDVRTWMPASRDRLDDLHLYPNVKYSFYYDYDIVSNIDLIRMLYPKTKNIAFVSDCSYGGVVMQALVRKEMEGFPDMKLILIDGRTNTLYTAIEKLRKLPRNTAIILGTSWRVDMSGETFSSNRLYDLLDSDIQLPVFTCAAVGLGYGAIGGVMPKFRPLGREMADGAVQFLEHPEISYNKITLIPTKCILDYSKVEDMGLDLNNLPYDIEEINHPVSFYEQYKSQIWTALFFLGMLIICFLGLLYAYIRIKALNVSLVKSEVELRAAKEKAEESNRLKSSFLANMSHEIRTPLNAIVGFTDVLTLGGLSPEEMKEYNAIINSNASALLRLINDILDLSRLEAGRDKLEIDTYDVISVSRMALDSVAVTCDKPIEFKFDSKFETYPMNTDMHRLRQVLTNLLTNAGKFTEQGSITLSISLNREDRKLVFSVTDTGCGIPAEKQATIFGRFEKLSEYTQGAGLGLSICKLIVTKLGGDIWVDQNYTDGARFVFTHPLDLEANVHHEETLMKE
jgi:signal transduction histidine kinase